MALFLTRLRTRISKALSPVSGRGSGWGMLVREAFGGAWQQNVIVDYNSVLSNSAVFRCISLIASDIAKMRIRLVQLDANGIWSEVSVPAFSPVLKKPNSYQNRIQFFEGWIVSKLTRGNAYVLKRRDSRGVVIALYVLDPMLVTVLVSESGDVYYQLNTDNLAGLPQAVTVPASEIIHDRFNCLFHPLVGLSPIFACGLAATQGLAIQKTSARFFENNSQPGGILTAPAAISDETAARLKAYWETNFAGDNAGKIAVVGDGLKYQAMAVMAVDAQLVEQLKMTAETVCSTFGVPPYKIGVGAQPLNNNVEALDQQYYSQCLQILIESIELCLDEGLGLDMPKDGKTYGTEFDLDDLLRMDTATLVKSEVEAVGGSLKAPNEARRRLNLPPVDGGNSPMSQQQNFSLAALAERDRDKPFAKPTASPDAAATDDAAKAMDEHAIEYAALLLAEELRRAA